MLKKMALTLFAVSALSATPQAIVFDWGKVLADPDRTAIVEFLCDSLGLTSEEFEQVNRQKQEEVPEIEYWIACAKIQERALPDDWRQRYRSVSRSALNVNDEMYELVEELKTSGIPVALLSNVQKRYADLIRGFGLYAPFEPCLLSSEMGVSKPDPKAFELLLEELSLPASDVVFIDDRPENIEAALNAGLDAILFESPSQLKKELSQRGLLQATSGS